MAGRKFGVRVRLDGDAAKAPRPDLRSAQHTGVSAAVERFILEQLGHGGLWTQELPSDLELAQGGQLPWSSHLPLNPPYPPAPLSLPRIQQPPRPPRRGGRPAKAIPPEVLIEAGAWLAAHGLPEVQADLERKLEDLLAAAGRAASEATVRRAARRLIDAHRRALGLP